MEDLVRPTPSSTAPRQMFQRGIACRSVAVINRCDGVFTDDDVLDAVTDRAAGWLEMADGVLISCGALLLGRMPREKIVATNPGDRPGDALSRALRDVHVVEVSLDEGHFLNVRG